MGIGAPTPYSEPLDGSPDQLGFLLSASPDALLIVDWAGRIQRVNSDAEVLFGYSATALIGKAVEELVPGSFRHRNELQPHGDLISATVQPLAAAVPLSARKQGGSTFPADVRLRSIRIGEEVITATWVRDLSERQREKDLAAGAEERFAALVRSIKDYAIFQVDAEGRITSWNDGAQRIKGYDASEIVGSPMAIFFTQEDIASGKPEWLLEQAKLHGRVEDEGWRVRKDGSKFWADAVLTAVLSASGEVICFAKVTRDLTQRLRAEELVRTSEQRFRAAIDGSVDAFYILRPVRTSGDGKIVDFEYIEVNATAEARHKRSRAELIGRRVSEVSPRTMNDGTFDTLVRVLTTGQREESEVQIDDPGIDIAWAHRQLIPLEDGLALSSRDITARKHAERELQLFADRLERSNQELQMFAHVASHDLQEPLRMVASYVQLLQKRYRGKLDADADKFIGYAVEGAVRMRDLINSLLAYSRVDSHAQALVATDCEKLIAGVLRDLKAKIDEASAVIEVGHMPIVLADGTQLGEVFLNLLANALKFRDGARIPKVRVHAERRANHWILSVQDNGIGIEPRHFERVFRAFQRLHARDEYPGSGIGLSICKKIVERHGGRIWIESQPGQGTTFLFTMPDAQAGGQS